MAKDDEGLSGGKLEDVFETSEDDAEDKEQEVEQEADKPELSSEDESDDKVEKDAETTAAEKDETANTKGEPWTKAAYLEEKRKRQELEKEIEKYKSPDPKQQETQVEVPDVFVDPTAFTKHLKDETANEIRRTRAALSQEFMRELKPDYDEKVSHFIEMVKTDQSLVNKMHDSPNPAKFAYETAVNALAQQARLKLADEIGDPVAYKEKLKQELIAELGLTAKSKPKFENTPSLATAPGVKSDSVKVLDHVNDMFEDDD